MKHGRGWLARLLLTLLGATVITRALSGGDGPWVSGESLLLLAASTLLWGALMSLHPGAGNRPSPLAATLLTGTTALILLTVRAPQPEMILVVLRLALGVAVVTFALAGVTALLSRLTGDSNAVSWWVVCIATLAATAPLWAGPLLETGRVGQPTVDLIVAVSPISYLATLADWDYLRGDWFYRHSPLGGLRYDYPSATIASLIYLGFGLGGHYLSYRGAGRNREPFPQSS